MIEKIKFYLLSISIFISTIWFGFFLWTHQPLHLWFTVVIILVWIVLAACTMLSYKQQHRSARFLVWTHSWLFMVSFISYFSLEARNDRQWQDETAKIIQFEFKDGHVEIDNVRNFIWRSTTDYDIRWEKRRYQIEKINSIDLIVSYFMQGPIAHVFISFGFENGEHLAFSLEVRQEQHEGFSTIGGFFRQYELALVVADENDAIYTRTNIRNEEVYLYPIKMQRHEMQMLFLEYLNTANRLNHRPVWYNTLTSNCTTILFDLLEHATGEIPRDYRILLPGLLPHYLDDMQLIHTNKTLKQWNKHAHLNSKVSHIQHIESIDNKDFSNIIRTLTP